MTTVNLLHFNDVYRVTAQNLAGSASSAIDCSQFAGLLEKLRSEWPKNVTDQSPDGLVLFSGDIFSPSVESTVTRGSHMVPVINEIAPDIALTGNHDFDFGFHHLQKLISDCQFPWILSNIVDTDTGKAPQQLERFKVFRKSGVTIGVIGLVEEEWIATVSSWPTNFKYQPMGEVGIELSKLLRDPTGEYKCDIVIALTHSRIPNDIRLAKQLGAVPEGKSASDHGIDIIFGGHDHMYYIGKGASSWDQYNLGEKRLGAEEDVGYLIVKSGTDFRDLSSIEAEVVDAPPGSTRRKFVKSLKGKHHFITPNLPASQPMRHLLFDLLKDVSSTLKKPVCHTLTQFDCRSSHVRMEESASGNWFADVLRHAYDSSLCVKGAGGSDGVLICGGTIRGDSIYGPGVVSLGDIMEILPFEDPIVVIAVDGSKIWQAMESALSTWPAQEGRFPIVSGFIVEWDSKRPPNQRVLGIWERGGPDTPAPETADTESIHGDSSGDAYRHRCVKGELVPKETGVKTYTVVTREYMAAGHDGYEALKGCDFVGGIDEEHGQIMNSIVRKYLLGLQFVNNLKDNLHDVHQTGEASQRRPPLSPPSSSGAPAKWKQVGQKIISQISRRHNNEVIGNALQTAETNSMTDVDIYDGAKARSGGQAENTPEGSPSAADYKGEIITVAPMIDGRMVNISANQ